MATPDITPQGDPTDWEGRWRAGNTPWDLGGPAPILAEVLQRLGDRALRVVVPGAGRAHDAVAFAAAGHAVTAVDISPTALAEAGRQAQALGQALELRQADWLEPKNFAAGAFDAVWEQTCYCAIPPARRGDYARTVAHVLPAGGRYIGLFWQHGREGGPPFHVAPDEVQADISPWFDIDSLEPLRDEVTPRGNEFLIWATRKA